MARVQATRVHRAAASGSVLKLQDALRQHPEAVNTGAHLNAAAGVTPLHQAARFVRQGQVQVLLDAGANVHAVDSKGRTALLLAAEAHGDNRLGNCTDCVRALLKAGARTAVISGDGSSQTALHHVAQAGCAPCVKALLAAGADVHAEDSRGSTALHCGCQGSRCPVTGMRILYRECVKALLAAGARIETADEGNWRAIHYVVGDEVGDSADVLRMLLAAGAEKDSQIGGGITPLALAARNGLPQCVTLLLAKGVNIEAAGKDGTTPLLRAAGSRSGPHTAETWRQQGNREACLQALIEAGTNVHAREAGSRSTALHWSAKLGWLPCIRRLAAAGADLAARDRQGRTPRQVAEQERQKAAAKMLQKLEAEQAVAAPAGSQARAAAAATRPVAAIQAVQGGVEEAQAGEAGGPAAAAAPEPAKAAGAAAAAAAAGAEVGEAAAEELVDEAAAAAPAAAVEAAPEAAVAAEPAAEPAAAAPLAEIAVEVGPGLLHRNIRVWWEEREEWVLGTITRCIMPERVFFVRHESIGQPDMRTQRYRLHKERFQLLGPDGGVEAKFVDGQPGQGQGNEVQPQGLGRGQQQGHEAPGHAGMAPAAASVRQQQQQVASRGSGERNLPGGGGGGDSGGAAAAAVGAAAAAAAGGPGMHSEAQQLEGQPEMKRRRVEVKQE